MLNLQMWACLFLFLFLIIASIDGFYFHIYKYQLFAREESKKEHLIHTLNAFLFPWTILLVFLDQFKGVYLWLGVFLTLLSLIIEFVDVFEENKSRKKIGGLVSLEYAFHFAMSSLRAVYTTLILVSKPSSSWLINGNNIELNTSFQYIYYFIYPVFFIGIAVFVLHFILVFYNKIEVKEIKHYE